MRFPAISQMLHIKYQGVHFIIIFVLTKFDTVLKILLIAHKLLWLFVSGCSCN